MSQAEKHNKFGVDLITFFHPAFWGVDDREGLIERAAADPRWFWDSALRAVDDAGLSAVEICFPPADWQAAVAAYGSPGAFRAALEGSRLTIVSGYLGVLEEAADVFDPSEQDRIVEETREYAAFLQECGGSVLATGMPVLERRGGAAFFDVEYAKRMADLVNRMGVAARQHGVTLALHTEMGSVFCARHDVDLFMLLTDPEYVGFCPDTAHITLAGSDPVAVLESHYERVVLTHWKDAAGRFREIVPDGENRHAYYRPYWRAVGDGVVDWGAWVRRLAEFDYDGWTILELDESADPVTDMRTARAFAEAVQHVSDVESKRTGGQLE